MSTREKKRADEPRTPVPAYIVTFSDMVTLLLTFFVLLLTLAEKRDIGLFQKGHDSFKRAIADFGLAGLLFNKDVSVQFTHPRIKYRTEKARDEAEDFSTDQAAETYRRILHEIERMIKIQPSQITAAEKIYTITDIYFADGDWTLNARAKSWMDAHAGQLRESFAREKPVMYVVGIAAGEPDERQRWLVSARRAQAVADYMQTALGADNGWTVYNWGAGSGGVWTAQRGVFSTNMHIAIAVLTEDTRSRR
jgi:chemotaxis protein MotB